MFTDTGFEVTKLVDNGLTKFVETRAEAIKLTEKCWAGYTQKGMKTMFGKKYPNCVKKTK